MTSRLQKLAQNLQFVTLLTSKSASRHNGVHFFDARTWKRWSEHVVFCTFLLPILIRATNACTFSTSQLPKVVREWCALPLLTCKCASRHNVAHFFDIATSKSRPTPTVFNTFYFQMCFAPRRRALFSTSQLPKMVRNW